MYSNLVVHLLHVNLHLLFILKSFFTVWTDSRLLPLQLLLVFYRMFSLHVFLQFTGINVAFLDASLLTDVTGVRPVKRVISDPVVIEMLGSAECGVAVLALVWPSLLVNSAHVLLEDCLGGEAVVAQLTLVRKFFVVDRLDVRGEVAVGVELYTALAALELLLFLATQLQVCLHVTLAAELFLTLGTLKHLSRVFLPHMLVELLLEFI